VCVAACIEASDHWVVAAIGGVIVGYVTVNIVASDY
jgi:hypothetical protein